MTDLDGLRLVSQRWRAVASALATAHEERAVLTRCAEELDVALTASGAPESEINPYGNAPHALEARRLAARSAYALAALLELGRATLVDLSRIESEMDAGYRYLAAWQDWARDLHHELGLCDSLTWPDDTAARALFGAAVRVVHGGRMTAPAPAVGANVVHDVFGPGSVLDMGPMPDRWVVLKLDARPDTPFLAHVADLRKV